MGGGGSKAKGAEADSRKSSKSDLKKSVKAPKEDKKSSKKESTKSKNEEFVPPAAPAPPKQIDVEKHETQEIKQRLSVQVGDVSHLKSALEEKEARMAAKMFAPVQEEKKSKIYQALNPQVLWYESRREKEMKNEENDDEAEDNRLAMRSGDMFSARIMDEMGNLMEEEDEEEEDLDPKNLPSFDPETEAELKKLRAERAIALEKRQNALRDSFLKKKAEEEAARNAEIQAILAEEAKKKKKEEVSDDFVKQAQARVAAEAANFGSFTFN